METLVFDWLVVGAGFSGRVIAERRASQRDEKVLLIDRRPHIGGNAYDTYDRAGVLIHQYGPHIFHTNSQAVFDHLSQFTEALIGFRGGERRSVGSVPAGPL